MRMRFAFLVRFHVWFSRPSPVLMHLTNINHLNWDAWRTIYEGSIQLYPHSKTASIFMRLTGSSNEIVINCSIHRPACLRLSLMEGQDYI